MKVFSVPMIPVMCISAMADAIVQITLNVKHATVYAFYCRIL